VSFESLMGEIALSSRFQFLESHIVICQITTRGVHYFGLHMFMCVCVCVCVHRTVLGFSFLLIGAVARA
jgi:hypothetical protein